MIVMMKNFKTSSKNKSQTQDDTVLVSVLKNKNDLRILLNEHWYRIPIAFLPKRPYAYIAFYQPAVFGENGKQISYYARVDNKITATRKSFLPEESNHPRANDSYLKLTFDEIQRLAKPIKNIIPRRVTFGFTSLERLLNSCNLLELYDVPATEQIIALGLLERGIPVSSQYPIGYSSGRFRIDLVVACQNGYLAIECDNNKAHRSRSQKQIDQHKNTVLGYYGWRLIRLNEDEILNHFDRSMARLVFAIASLGGLLKPKSGTKLSY